MVLVLLLLLSSNRHLATLVAALPDVHANDKDHMIQHTHAMSGQQHPLFGSHLASSEG